LISCNKINNTVDCGGVSVDLDTYEAEANTEDGLLKLKSVVYVNGSDINENIQEGKTLPFSIALIPSGDSYKAILMDPALANSMFTKLFFFKGHGLEHFELFYEERQVTGGNILIWKVNWQGEEGGNQVYENQEDLSIDEEVSPDNETE
jgi:hypothetical protein